MGPGQRMVQRCRMLRALCFVAILRERTIEKEAITNLNFKQHPDERDRPSFENYLYFAFKVFIRTFFGNGHDTLSFLPESLNGCFAIVDTARKETGQAERAAVLVTLFSGYSPSK